jgi:hypothetical protein
MGGTQPARLDPWIDPRIDQNRAGRDRIGDARGTDRPGPVRSSQVQPGKESFTTNQIDFERTDTHGRQ